MTKENDWNWPLATAVMALLIVSLILLAIPKVRIVGLIILGGYWILICVAARRSYNGAPKTDSNSQTRGR